MSQDWQELTNLTNGRAFTVERVKLKDNRVAIEGSFELSPLARLSMEDQVFIAAFVRSHGSIKEMEEMFGISYPTVKNRLNRLAKQLSFVEVNPVPPRNEVLASLERGEISVDDAVKKMRGDT